VAKATPPAILGREATLAQALEPPGEGAESVLRDFYSNAAGLPANCTPATPTPAGVIGTRRPAWRACAAGSIHAAGGRDLPQADHRHRPHTAEGEGAEVVTQFEMHAIEDLGLLKMDFLGLRNLSTIERARSN